MITFFVRGINDEMYTRNVVKVITTTIGSRNMAAPIFRPRRLYPDKSDWRLYTVQFVAIVYLLRLKESHI